MQYFVLFQTDSDCLQSVKQTTSRIRQLPDRGGSGHEWR